MHVHGKVSTASGGHVLCFADDFSKVCNASINKIYLATDMNDMLSDLSEAPLKVTIMCFIFIGYNCLAFQSSYQLINVNSFSCVIL